MTRSDIIRKKTYEVCEEFEMASLASLRNAANELYDRTYKALADQNEATAVTYAARGDITPWQAAVLIRCSIADHLPAVVDEIADRVADKVDAILDRMDEADIDLSKVDLSEIDPNPDIALQIIRVRHILRKKKLHFAAVVIIDSFCCGFTHKEREATLDYLRSMAVAGCIDTISDSEFIIKSIPESTLVREALRETL